MSSTDPDSWRGIVVVEDDASLREALIGVLEHEGHEVEALGDAEALLAKLPPLDPALVILDVGLPGIDGVEACRQLRARGYEDAVLMLTARHEVGDRVRGLDAGADDYVVKPFALAELLARVRSHLRRTAPVDESTPQTIADLSLDPGTRRVERSGEEVELTRLEFDLLELLVSNSPRVLTREVIHDRVWGHDGTFMSNSLEVAISQLRRKLDADPEHRLIHTVRGVGYVVREP
ncbi:MAG: response regulator transcription factor [Actinomycetota bacterium]